MNALWEKHRHKLLPAIAALGAVAVLVVFRKPVVAWFSPERAAGGESAPGHVHGAAPGSAAPEVALPRVALSPATLSSIEVAYSAYEDVRKALASDSMDGVAPAATRAEHALHAAAQSLKDAPRVTETLHSGAAAAKRLAGDREIEAARKSFGELSRALISIATADERLASGKHFFSCPMAKPYDRWLQPSERMENPYMGPKMLQCGSAVDLSREAAGAAPDAIAHYTCPMHPSVKRAGPGQCPICNMDLVPVTKREVETGVIIVDAERRQRIGVKIGVVERRQLDKTIRTVGKITYDQTRIVDVTLKFSGFIAELFADAPGKKVKKGHALFTVYSPEIYQAQQDLIIAHKNGAGPIQSGALLESAKRRLELLDVGKGTIERVLQTEKPMRHVPIASPASGFIVEKRVFDGSAFEAGTQLMRIANLDKVWIEADLYEAELPLVKVGQPAIVTLPYLPDKRIEGKITFIYPYLSGETRTGKVRIEIANKKVELKPDMFANVELDVARGERLVVPESAVIYAGPRRVVFIDLGEGKLRPQRIEVGVKTGDYYEVLSGLTEGDRVVTSGNFLIAAESRLKSAMEQW